MEGWQLEGVKLNIINYDAERAIEVKILAKASGNRHINYFHLYSVHIWRPSLQNSGQPKLHVQWSR